MPWVAFSSQTTRLTFVLWISLFISFVRMDCNTTKMTVPIPKPNLKYMWNGFLHVTWSDESHGSWNYSANYCCQKVHKDDVGWCERPCPRYAKMASCDFKKNLCMILSKQFMKYQVYLSVEFQGCSFSSVVKELTPRLMIAHPPQVPIINMVNENNRMVVQWSEPSTTKNIQGVCYSVICHGMKGLNQGKQVINKSRHKSQTVFIDYDPSRHPFTSYMCCVKVHFCTFGPIFSDEVCNQSRTPATAPSHHPKMLCGYKNKCPSVRVKNGLRDITLYWQLPVNSSYNGVIPTEIMLAVRKGNENSTVTYTLNGTATTYVLRGLEVDVDYHVTLKSCIHHRCSSISTPVLLRAEMEKSGDTVDAFNSLDLIIVVLVGAVILVLVLIACYIVDTRRNRGTAEQASLPSLQEPNVDLPHDQAWSGESVATSIAMNIDYDRLNGRHCERLHDNDPDNISQNSNGSGYDTCSVDSYESSSGHPLLSKHSSKKTEANVNRQRVTVTYLPQQPGTITSLKPCISDDEGSKFV